MEAVLCLVRSVPHFADFAGIYLDLMIESCGHECDGCTGPDGNDRRGNRTWQSGMAAMLAAVVVGTGMNAGAELNRFEADTRGEFGVGSAAQYGSADLRSGLAIKTNPSGSERSAEYSTNSFLINCGFAHN